MNAVRGSSKRFFVPGLLFLISILLATSPLYAPVYTVVLLTSIFMYIIITMSWSLFSGPTGYISLAPAAFFGVGVYTSALLGFALPLPVIVATGGLVGFCLAHGLLLHARYFRHTDAHHLLNQKVQVWIGLAEHWRI